MARHRREDVECGGRLRAAHLGTVIPTKEGCAAHRRNLGFRVWATGHDPRDDITPYQGPRSRASP